MYNITGVCTGFWLQDRSALSYTEYEVQLLIEFWTQHLICTTLCISAGCGCTTLSKTASEAFAGDGVLHCASLKVIELSYGRLCYGFWLSFAEHFCFTVIVNSVDQRRKSLRLSNCSSLLKACLNRWNSEHLKIEFPLAPARYFVPVYHLFKDCYSPT